MVPLPQDSASGAPPAAPVEGEHIELVERYFDDNAQDWSDLYRSARRANDVVLAARRDAAVQALAERVEAGGRILDAGCGAGLTALELVRRGFRVHLVDVSRRMLDLAAQNLSAANAPAERYEITRGDPIADLERARAGSASYDGIAALGFLQYQPDEARALRALHAALRPGGVLVVTGPNATRLADGFGLARLVARARRRLARRRAGPPPSAAEVEAARAAGRSRALLHRISAHAYSFGRFRALLEAAGFELLARRGHGFVNFAVIGPRLGFRGELFLHRALSAAARVLPIDRWANDLIVVARRR